MSQNETKLKEDFFIEAPGDFQCTFASTIDRHRLVFLDIKTEERLAEIFLDKITNVNMLIREICSLHGLEKIREAIAEYKVYDEVYEVGDKVIIKKPEDPHEFSANIIEVLPGYRYRTDFDNEPVHRDHITGFAQQKRLNQTQL